MTTFHSTPIIGQRVLYTDGDSSGSGLYIGVALDEEDRVPYHYFIDGEINGIPQDSFGFPAEEGTEVTTDFTPTELITSEISNRIKIKATTAVDQVGNASLIVTKEVLVGGGLDWEHKEIANYTLSFWPASREVVLTSLNPFDSGDEVAYESEIVYSTEVS